MATAVLVAEDSSIRELKEQPRVAYLLEHYPTHNGLKAAINVIANQNVSLKSKVKAVCKAFRANHEGLKVFISYCSAHHEDAATELHRVLDTLGNDKMDVFVDRIDIARGMQWFDTIRERLRLSHYFIMIVPDDSSRLHWPIFEAGYFSGNMTLTDHLIPVHHSEVSIPDEIGHFQGIIANDHLVRLGVPLGEPLPTGGILSLLLQILVRPDPVPGFGIVNAKADRNILRDHAEKIASLVASSYTSNRVTMRYVELELPQQGPVASVEYLLDANVVRGQGYRDLFDFSGSDGASLREVLGGSDSTVNKHRAWIQELSEAVSLEARGRAASSPRQSFSDTKSMRNFRAHLHSVKIKKPVTGFSANDEERATSIQVVFCELLGGSSEGPPKLKVLRTALRLAARTRWEILEPYKDVFAEDKLQEIIEKLRLIELEAEVNGLMDFELMKDQFDEEGASKLEGLKSRWLELRGDGSSEGTLERAIDAGNAAEVRQHMREWKKINYDFVVLASERYSELIKDAWL